MVIYAVPASDAAWATYILSSPMTASVNNNSLVSPASTISDFVNDLSAYGPISCLQNPPLPAEQIYDPIQLGDYSELLEQIVVDDDAMRQITRAFRPGDFKQRIAGDCLFSMGILPGPGQTFSVPISFRQIEMAHVVAKIKQKCFVGGSILGGTTRYGPNLQVLLVLGAKKFPSSLIAAS